MRTSGYLESHNQHRKAFPELVREMIRISDIVLEILDGRDIRNSRNKELEQFVLENEKKLIQVINKADLLDVEKLRADRNFAELSNPIFVSSMSRQGISRLREIIMIESKRLKQKRKTRIAMVGYPNVGKSSLINILVRRNAAPVSAQAGWTKGIREIRFTKDILILDAPGVIREGERLEVGQETLRKHARIGVQTPERMRDPVFIVTRLIRENPGVIERKYFINSNGDIELFLNELGKKKNFLKKGGEIDWDRTARDVLKDWQKGLLKIKR